MALLIPAPGDTVLITGTVPVESVGMAREWKRREFEYAHDIVDGRFVLKPGDTARVEAVRIVAGGRVRPENERGVVRLVIDGVPVAVAAAALSGNARLQQ